jgi:hypothetical protein
MAVVALCCLAVLTPMAVSAAPAPILPVAHRPVGGPGPAPHSAASFRAPSITLSPGLNRRYSPAVSDYVVRCTSGPTVRVSVRATRGTWVSVDGSRWRSGRFVRSVALKAGQAFPLWSGGSGHVHRATVRCLPGDFPRFRTSGHGTAQWYAFDEYLGGGTHYAFVTDARGTPVWWYRDPAQQPSAIRFWDRAELTGLGSARRYAFSYEANRITNVMGLDGTQIATLGAGLSLDPHDLEPAADGTYWSLRGVRRDCPSMPSECVDMTAYPGGTAADTLVDNQIVHFDAAGHQLWTWQTRQHIGLAESERMLNLAFVSAHQADGSWDLVHFNSVQPDGRRAVIVSARNLDAVYKINTVSGVIVWKLGGTTTPKSLTVLGDPVSTLTLGGPHDARLLLNGNLTVYDDATDFGRPARAVEYAINARAGTARVVSSVTDPRMTTPSVCCGSARRLPNGHWVVAWGGTQLISEVLPNGHPVLTIKVAPTLSPYRVVPLLAGVVPASALRKGMNAQYPR